MAGVTTNNPKHIATDQHKNTLFKFMVVANLK